MESQNKIKDIIRVWTKVYGLLLINVFKNYVWIKVLFLIIMIFETFLIDSTLDFEGYRAVALGIGIFMSINTTYIVEGARHRVWSKEFGVYINDKEDAK